MNPRPFPLQQCLTYMYILGDHGWHGYRVVVLKVWWATPRAGLTVLFAVGDIIAVGVRTAVSWFSGCL